MGAFLDKLSGKTSDDKRPLCTAEEGVNNTSQLPQQSTGRCRKDSTDSISRSYEIVSIQQEHEPACTAPPNATKKKKGKNSNMAEDQHNKLQIKFDALTQKYDKTVEKLKQAQAENEALQEQLKEISSTLETETREKDRLLHRLSEAAGAKLVDNNPNITDLSDENRATKLAEQFSELYDNQWTDAYTLLTDEYNFSEESAISSLLGVTQKVFCCMRKLSENSWNCMETSILEFLSTSVEDVELQIVQKQLKDLRKRKASQALENLLKKTDKTLECDTEVITAYSYLKKTDFLRKSVILLWMMAIQDPPLALCFKGESGDIMQKDKYRTYTTDGKNIKYIVWPALYLHDGGPLLCKGVAQGEKTKQKR